MCEGRTQFLLELETGQHEGIAGTLCHCPCQLSASNRSSCQMAATFHLSLVCHLPFNGVLRLERLLTMPSWVSSPPHSRNSGIQPATDGSDSHAGVSLWSACFILTVPRLRGTLICLEYGSPVVTMKLHRDLISSCTCSLWATGTGF